MDWLFATGAPGFAMGVLIGSGVGLLLILAAILAASLWKWAVPNAVYHVPLYVVAALAIAYGVWTAGRVATVIAGDSKAYDAFKPELVSFILFWVLIPPSWFFVEYFAFDMGAIALPQNAALRPHLESLRAYADYASKIWAALAALLLGAAAILIK